MFYASMGKWKNMYAQIFYDFPLGHTKAQPNYAEHWTYATDTDQKTLLFPAHTHVGRKSVDVDNTFRETDFSFLRLKTAELSYRLPVKYAKKLGLSSLNAYLNGNNLYTWSKVDKRIDPENGDISSYPMVRTVTLGLRIGF